MATTDYSVFLQGVCVLIMTLYGIFALRGLINKYGGIRSALKTLAQYLLTQVDLLARRILLSVIQQVLLVIFKCLRRGSGSANAAAVSQV